MIRGVLGSEIISREKICTWGARKLAGKVKGKPRKHKNPQNQTHNTKNKNHPTQKQTPKEEGKNYHDSVLGTCRSKKTEIAERESWRKCRGEPEKPQRTGGTVHLE